MSPTDDVAEIIAIGARVEALTSKYEPLLVEWSDEVRRRYPSGPGAISGAYRNHLVNWPVTTANNTHILDEDTTTPERIAFRYTDYDGSTGWAYLPVLWLTDREAWHEQAAAEQAEYPGWRRRSHELRGPDRGRR